MSVVSDPQDRVLFETATQLMQKNQLGKAKTLFLQLLEKNPADFAAHHKLAEIYLVAEQYQSALQHLVNAVQGEPENAYYLYRLGYTMLKMNHTEQAIKSLELAIRIDSTQAEPYPLLATIYHSLGQEDKALEYYLAKASELNIPEVYEEIGRIYHLKEQYDSAEHFYQQALAVKPGLKSAQLHLAKLMTDRLISAWYYDASALSTIRHLCQGQPRGATLYIVLATVALIEGGSAEAIEYYRAALAEEPDNRVIRGNLAIVLLRHGQYQEGWRELHGRKAFTSHDHGFVSQTIAGVSAPEWTGEVQPGTTLLVNSEQGVGDQLLNVQHLLPLAIAGMQIILRCNVKLVSLFSRSFPQFCVLPDNEMVTMDLRDKIDYQVYLLDIPYFIKLNPDRYQAPHTYLTPDPKQVEQFKRADQSKQFRVGIAWSSSSSTSGSGKTIPLEKLIPLLQQPGCEFFSIQYGDAVKDVQQLDEHYSSLITIDESFDPYDDLDKAAAQIASLDLVISISNAAVHLAGALGITTWVMLQKVALWHWFEDREDSPWYPTVRLFRQTTHSDWDSVVQRVTSELQKLTTESR